MEDLCSCCKNNKSPEKPQHTSFHRRAANTQNVKRNVKELNGKRPLSYLGPIAELGEVSPPQKDSLSGKRKPDRIWMYLWTYC